MRLCHDDCSAVGCLSPYHACINYIVNNEYSWRRSGCVAKNCGQPLQQRRRFSINKTWSRCVKTNSSFVLFCAVFASSSILVAAAARIRKCDAFILIYFRRSAHFDSVHLSPPLRAARIAPVGSLFCSAFSRFHLRQCLWCAGSRNLCIIHCRKCRIEWILFIPHHCCYQFCVYCIFPWQKKNQMVEIKK